MFNKKVNARIDELEEALCATMRQVARITLAVMKDDDPEGVLAKMFSDEKTKKDTNEQPRQKRAYHRKKHNHKKVCDVCGRVCKGNSGLGVHKYNAHGIRAQGYVRKMDIKSN